jgi:hypothetical protein
MTVAPDTLDASGDDVSTEHDVAIHAVEYVALIPGG